MSMSLFEIRKCTKQQPAVKVEITTVDNLFTLFDRGSGEVTQCMRYWVSETSEGVLLNALTVNQVWVWSRSVGGVIVGHC